MRYVLNSALKLPNVEYNMMYHSFHPRYLVCLELVFFFSSLFALSAGNDTVVFFLCVLVFFFFLAWN